MKVPVCFVFNGPTLIPWRVVEGVKEGDILETVLSWQETKRSGHRYKVNDDVADVNNPGQKMTIRRILYVNVTVGTEVRKHIRGFECYWWHEQMESLPATLVGARVVPGMSVVE